MTAGTSCCAALGKLSSRSAAVRTLAAIAGGSSVSVARSSRNIRAAVAAEHRRTSNSTALHCLTRPMVCFVCLLAYKTLVLPSTNMLASPRGEMYS